MVSCIQTIFGQIKNIRLKRNDIISLKIEKTIDNTIFVWNINNKYISEKILKEKTNYYFKLGFYGSFIIDAV